MTPASPVTELVCEVCALRQPPATRCARCDLPMRLPRGMWPVADPPITPLPGLEPTTLDPVLLLSEETVPGFEPTIAEAVDEVAAFHLPGFEPTADALVDVAGDMPPPPGIERTPDFERTAPPTAPGIPPRCPYCGFVQREGRVCNHCGRSKVRLLVGNPEAVRALVGADRVRCRSCGASVPDALLCSDCGLPLPD